jgi:adenylosuccinate synthase
MNKFNTLVVVGAQWGDEGKGNRLDCTICRCCYKI